MQEDNIAEVDADDIQDLPLALSPDVERPAESPTESQATDSKETTETPAKETTEANETKATNESEESQETEETETDTSKGKPDPSIAAQAFQDRQRTRQAVERQIDNVYAPKSQDDLYQENINRGLDEQQAQYEAQIQAIREEMQYDKQRTFIAELNAGMQAEAVNVEHDFGIYNPKSSEYDAEFTAKVEARYQRVARLQTDDNGLILNAEEPLYDFYKEMADMYSHSANKGSQQGQKEALETLSRTEAVGSSSSTSRGTETLEEMGERLADMPIF